MQTARDASIAELAEILAVRAGGSRLMVGLAGPPGSGKSTCADELNARVNAAGGCRSEIVPMDGFHYDDGVLSARGLLPRKGSPDTFDVGGLLQTLKRLKRNDEPEVAVPVFDRKLEISRGSARIISREVGVLIVEGNYLLLGRHPWADLAPLFDVTIGILSAEDVLRQRLVARWEGYGISAEEILRKVDGNDMLNGYAVLSSSIAPDYVLRT